MSVVIIASRLVSELASEGASGRLLCQVRGSSVRASFWPFTSRICVLTEKVSGPAGHFFPTVVTETCHENVTVPKIDQLFWPFAMLTSILSSDFWSRNRHDRDMNPPQGSFAHEFRNQTGGHLPCGCILVSIHFGIRERY